MLPSWRDWIFSAKTFIGAMLALWIALRMGLDRPYWAMATAYIVAQPLTGAMRSKAAYRFYGTVLGAVAPLVLDPQSGRCAGAVDCRPVPVGRGLHLFRRPGPDTAELRLPAGWLQCGADRLSDRGRAGHGLGRGTRRGSRRLPLGLFAQRIGSIVFPIPLGPALTARLDNWI